MIPVVLRPLLRWPDRQQAALAFDHDIAGIGCGWRDQRDPAAAVMDDLVANTLRTAAGLAKAETGQQQPGPPIAFRGLLVGPVDQVLSDEPRLLGPLFLSGHLSCFL